MMINSMRSSLLKILEREFENKEISLSVSDWILSSNEKFHLSFYSRPVMEHLIIPELAYLDKKLERVSSVVKSIENGLDNLKDEVKGIEQFDRNDSYGVALKAKRIQRLTKRLAESIERSLTMSSADFKEITKRIPRFKYPTVDYYYDCTQDTIELVNSCIKSNDVITYRVPHLSFLKSSSGNKVELYSSFRLAPKMGHGNSIKAEIVENKFIVNSNHQIWIS